MPTGIGSKPSKPFDILAGVVIAPDDQNTPPILAGQDAAGRLIYVIPRIQVLRALRDEVTASRLKSAEGTAGLTVTARAYAERKLSLLMSEPAAFAIESCYIGRDGNAIVVVTLRTLPAEGAEEKSSDA